LCHLWLHLVDFGILFGSNLLPFAIHWAPFYLHFATRLQPTPFQPPPFSRFTFLPFVSIYGFETIRPRALEAFAALSRCACPVACVHQVARLSHCNNTTIQQRLIMGSA
jgi:hypothetical protein